MHTHIHPVNRRDFNTTLLGGAALGALPIAASRAPASAATRGPLVAWATAIARAQNRASPALLAQQLKIPMETAQGLYAALLKDGVIRAPIAGGLAKAAKPVRMRLAASAKRPIALQLKQAKRALEMNKPIAPSSCQKTFGATETEKSSQDFSHRADEGCARPDGASGPAITTSE